MFEAARIDLGTLPTSDFGFYERQRELVEIGGLLATRPQPKLLTVTLHGGGGIARLPCCGRPCSVLPRCSLLPSISNWKNCLIWSAS